MRYFQCRKPVTSGTHPKQYIGVVLMVYAAYIEVYVKMYTPSISVNIRRDGAPVDGMYIVMVSFSHQRLLGGFMF